MRETRLCSLFGFRGLISPRGDAPRALGELTLALVPGLPAAWAEILGGTRPPHILARGGHDIKCPPHVFGTQSTFFFAFVCLKLQLFTVEM